MVTIGLTMGVIMAQTTTVGSGVRTLMCLDIAITTTLIMIVTLVGEDSRVAAQRVDTMEDFTAAEDLLTAAAGVTEEVVTEEEATADKDCNCVIV
jgi:hypothetical protein